MTPEQALATLDKVYAQAHVSRDVQDAIRLATAALQKFIGPVRKPPEPKEEEAR